MLAGGISDPRAPRLIERLDKTIGAMSGLLDKLLDINQLEAGVVKPKLCDFAIGDLLKHLQDEFEIHAANAGLSLRVAPCTSRYIAIRGSWSRSFATCSPTRPNIPAKARSFLAAAGEPGA